MSVRPGWRLINRRQARCGSFHQQPGWPISADIRNLDGQECLFVPHIFWETLALGIQAVRSQTSLVKEPLVFDQRRLVFP